MLPLCAFSTINIEKIVKYCYNNSLSRECSVTLQNLLCGGVKIEENYFCYYVNYVDYVVGCRRLFSIGGRG